MAMMSLRGDGSVIAGMCDSTRLTSGKLQVRGMLGAGLVKFQRAASLQQGRRQPGALPRFARLGRARAPVPTRPALGAAWERTLVLAELPVAAIGCPHAQSSVRAPKARRGLLLSPASAERSSPGSSRPLPHPPPPRSRDISRPAPRALPAPKFPRPRALHPAPSATTRPTPSLPPPCNPCLLYTSP